ncbi:MAG TPA: hypothetical protein VI583_10190 [Cyclobacteriaceae bacterium]|nr:hypothetical protein [Cyclobacteriaceae bacterium]
MKNKGSYCHRNYRNILFHLAVLALVFLLVVTRTSAVQTAPENQVETASKDDERNSQGSDDYSLDVYTPIASYQVHFDHVCRIIINLPIEIVSSGRRVCFNPDFLNNYFHALFQFIIATKAP